MIAVVTPRGTQAAASSSTVVAETAKLEGEAPESTQKLTNPRPSFARFGPFFAPSTAKKKLLLSRCNFWVGQVSNLARGGFLGVVVVSPQPGVGK